MHSLYPVPKEQQTSLNKWGQPTLTAKRQRAQYKVQCEVKLNEKHYSDIFCRLTRRNRSCGSCSKLVLRRWVRILPLEYSADQASPFTERLASSSSNPSCFYLALQAIPGSVTCESLATSDSARVDVAAAMAVCELKTAGHGTASVPRECTDWQANEGTTAKCVE